MASPELLLDTAKVQLARQLLAGGWSYELGIENEEHSRRSHPVELLPPGLG